MKTKDLNYIEAYEFYKQGYSIIKSNEEGALPIHPPFGLDETFELNLRMFLNRRFDVYECLSSKSFIFDYIPHNSYRDFVQKNFIEFSKGKYKIIIEKIEEK